MASTEKRSKNNRSSDNDLEADERELVEAFANGEIETTEFDGEAEKTIKFP